MIMKATRTAVKLATRSSNARGAGISNALSPKSPLKPIASPTISPAAAPSKLSKRRSPPVVPVPAANKQARLITLLRSPKGATIEQMTQLTGWQPHTVRGTISGALRKRLGLNVLSAAPLDSKARVYRIVDAAAA